MKQNKFKIMIGELNIKTIVVSSFCGSTYFISELILDSEYYREFTTDSVIKVKEILMELGIREDSISIEGIKDGE